MSEPMNLELQAVIEGGSTTKPTHRGAVTGCTNPMHLHFADAAANMSRFFACKIEKSNLTPFKDGE